MYTGNAAYIINPSSFGEEFWLQNQSKKACHILWVQEKNGIDFSFLLKCFYWPYDALKSFTSVGACIFITGGFSNIDQLTLEYFR